MLSVVIPTRNEREALPLLFAQLRQVETVDEIVVVDDSTDETFQYLLKQRDIKVVKGENRGLAHAIEQGIREASGDTSIVMDADGSHPVELIPELYREAQGADVVIATRESTDYPLRRRVMTFFSTLLCRPLTSVSDPLSGFFAVHYPFSSKAKGYKYLLELLVKHPELSVREVRYHFNERVAGESKTNLQVVLSSLKDLFWLYVHRLQYFLRFCIVGGLGVMVNLLLFSLLLFSNQSYLVAGGVAFCGAASFNYLLNKQWTFHSEKKATGTYPFFILISLGGLLINLVVLSWLVETVHLCELGSQLAGIAAATSWNYLLSKRLFLQDAYECVNS